MGVEKPALNKDNLFEHSVTVEKARNLIAGMLGERPDVLAEQEDREAYLVGLQVDLEQLADDLAKERMRLVREDQD